MSQTGRILAVETSCDETAVAVVDNGRRIVTNVVASQVALHAATGGIVPEVAARAHLRWMIPVLEQARAGGHPRLVGAGSGRRDGRPGARRLAAGRHHDGQDARLGPRPAARAGQPPRGPHLRGVAARPERGGQAGAGVPGRGARRLRWPYLPGRDEGQPDLSAARPDRRRRRGGGVRQGRPAARAAVSGWPGDHEGGRRSGRSRSRLSASVVGRDVRLFVQRAEDGGTARGRARAGHRCER